jgi:predicted acylesterase/phospholipase RssA
MSNHDPRWAIHARIWPRRLRVFGPLFLPLIVVLGLTLIVVGCAGTDRLPAEPLSIASKISVDIPDARFYPHTDKERMAVFAAQSYKRALAAHHGHLPTAYFLAISGGGDDGAFGAGLLAGWRARGDRPVFDLVTGVSTGALSAPFAFLGGDYDAKLKQVYTDTSAGDIFNKRGLLAAVTNDAMTDTTPLRNMIASFVDEAMIKRIAEEYGRGVSSSS